MCGTSFGRKDVLTKHKKTHENQKQKESSDPPPPPSAKKQRIAEHYECNICSASFENVQELKDNFFNPSGRKQWRWGGISWLGGAHYGESIGKCT